MTSYAVQYQQQYDQTQVAPKRMLCYNTLNKKPCTYGNRCKFAHAINEQKIDPVRFKAYSILKDQNNGGLEGIDLVNNKRLLNVFIQLSKVCYFCSKNICPGGYNCRNGATNIEYKICYDDLMYGNCNKDDCNGVHLTVRGLAPYSKQMISNNCSNNKADDILNSTSSSNLISTTNLFSSLDKDMIDLEDGYELDEYDDNEDGEYGEYCEDEDYKDTRIDTNNVLLTDDVYDDNISNTSYVEVVSNDVQNVGTSLVEGHDIKATSDNQFTRHPEQPVSVWNNHPSIIKQSIIKGATISRSSFSTNTNDTSSTNSKSYIKNSNLSNKELKGVLLTDDFFKQYFKKWDNRHDTNRGKLVNQDSDNQLRFFTDNSHSNLDDSETDSDEIKEMINYLNDDSVLDPYDESIFS